MRIASTLVALGCWASAAAVNAPLALSQATGPTCPTVKDANNQPVPDPACVNAATPGVPKRFPYPGEQTSAVPSEGAIPQAPSAAGTPSTPSASAPAGKRFPFPGEPGSSADSSPAKTPTANGQTNPGDPGGLKDAGSSGESSSSSSSSSSAGAPASSDSSSSSSNPAGDAASGSPFTDPDAGDTPAPKRARRKLPPVPRQTPSEQEEEDVRIAGFYQNTGNYKAAYERAKDAITLSTDDPDAHLAFAEAARRLGKLDEAQQHYRKCLDLDPVPKVRRVAEKALKEMSGGA